MKLSKTKISQRITWTGTPTETSRTTTLKRDRLPLDDRILSSCKALSEADVLLAADVAYDSSVIGCLAQTVRTFLTGDSSGGPKQVLFAKNLRNKETSNLLERELENVGIRSRVLATGHACEELPVTFPTKFVQPRSDIRICSLELDSTKRL